MNLRINSVLTMIVFLLTIIANICPLSSSAQSLFNNNLAAYNAEHSRKIPINIIENHSKYNPISFENSYHDFSDSLVNAQKNESRICNRVKKAIGNYSSDFWYVASAPFRINKKSALILGGVLAVGSAIFIYDDEVASTINRNRNNDAYKAFVDVADFVEPMGISEYTIPFSFGCYTVGYFLKFDSMKDISYQLFESLTIAVVFKNIIANSVGRARPNSGKGPRFFKFASSASFFSGHASNVFQAARILSYHVDFLPFKIICYGSAILVGFHRLDNEMHWASDIFIGAVYGTTVASAILKLNEKRKIKVVPNISPNINYFGLKVSYQF